MSEGIHIKSGHLQWQVDEGWRVGLPQLKWENFEVRLGAILVRVDSLRIEGLRTPKGESQRTMAVVEGLTARGVRVEGEGLDLQLDSFELPKGFRVKSDGEFLCQAASLEGLRFEVNVKPAVPSGGESVALENWAFLDALEGQLNVDLAVDLTGPLIGRRRETHKFRIPIDAGSIDYEEFEDDVNWLERSFLDILLVKEHLVVARDLPLLPFAKKALLWWQLDPEEKRLAQRKRVKLRTLRKWEVPPLERDRRARKSSLHLNSITAHHIDALLGLRNHILLELGAHGSVELRAADEGQRAELRATGEIRHRDDAELNTQLGVLLKNMSLGLNSLRVRDHEVSLGAMDIDHDDAISLSIERRGEAKICGTVASMRTRALRVAPMRVEPVAAP